MPDKAVLQLELEVDEDPSEVFIVFFDAMVQLFNMSLVQEAKYLLFQLPTSLARDDLNELDFPLNRFLYNTIKLRVDLIAAVVDVVQVEDRVQLQQKLSDVGIGTGIHYPIALHLTKAYEALGFRLGDFPMTEKAAARILSLPMFPGLTSDQQERVVTEVLKSLAANSTTEPT